ncbi:MAG: hypothetical protein Q8L23_13720 [Caulobacter sp.]|nr:hypothetical protein [Caulobacter sp.]
MKNENDPIVSSGSDESPRRAEPKSSVIDGPPPSNWDQVRQAWRSMRTRLQRQAPAAAKPSRKRRAEPAEADAAPAGIKAFERVHGKPMIWMAPFFLAFAFVFAFPHAARLLAPEAPRAAINDLVARLPEVLSPLSAMMAGWLWLPWFVALPALLMRLRAAWTTRSAIMDAVGWSMAALVIEGGAWLYFGRKALESAGAAERTGAWQLLVAEFIFLFLVATVLGPHTPKPRYFNQNNR